MSDDPRMDEILAAVTALADNVQAISDRLDALEENGARQDDGERPNECSENEILVNEEPVHGERLPLEGQEDDNFLQSYTPEGTHDDR